MRRRTFLLTALGAAAAGCAGSKPGERPFSVGFVPKLKTIPYFQACEKGAREAATELGLRIEANGPDKAEVNPQVDLLNQWALSGEFDCLTVACNDPDLCAPALREARKRGLRVVTFDADTQEDARDCFVNQGTYDDVSREMTDALAAELSPPGVGKVALLTSSVTAPNQSQWARRIKAYVKEKYPQMEILPETEHGEEREEGVKKARQLLQAHPDLKGFIGLTSVAVPAAAEAVRQLGKKGQVKVGGVSTPKDMRDYVRDDTVTTFVLWNPIDLGYLTVHVAHLLRTKPLPESGTMRAGRLGEIQVRGREVLLGKPMRFHKGNIDQFDF